MHGSLMQGGPKSHPNQIPSLPFFNFLIPSQFAKSFKYFPGCAFGILAPPGLMTKLVDWTQLVLGFKFNKTRRHRSSKYAQPLCRKQKENMLISSGRYFKIDDASFTLLILDIFIDILKFCSGM